jgi:hypothetical protein
MRFSRKDVVATALVAAAVAAYAGYLAFGSVPLIEDARGMAAVGLILGFASRRIGGRAGFSHERAAFAAGLGSMALGIAALATENEAILALFMASIVALWAAAMYVHTGGYHGRVRVSH